MTSLTRLGLLGKSIAHSRSPEIYRRLIDPSIQYDLLDIADAQDIPSAQELALSYEGLNITTPWKNIFADLAVPEVAHLRAVNCVRFTGPKFEATNTDWTALKKLLPEMLTRHGAQPEYVLLGDGVMARLTIDLLRKFSIPFVQYARSKGDDVAHLVLENTSNTQKKLLINACGRDFVFQGTLRGTWVFWDFNYAFAPHETSVPSAEVVYANGLELLETQAKHAIQFWNRTLSH